MQSLGQFSVIVDADGVLHVSRRLAGSAAVLSESVVRECELQRGVAQDRVVREQYQAPSVRPPADSP